MHLFVGAIGVIALVAAIIRASTSGVIWLLFRWRLQNLLAATTVILLLVLTANHLLLNGH